MAGIIDKNTRDSTFHLRPEGYAHPPTPSMIGAHHLTMLCARAERRARMGS